MPHLNVSEAGLQMVKAYEKCARLEADGLYHAYQARIQGKLDKPTIGWGETGEHIFMGMDPWTKEQCDESFSRRVAREFEPSLNDVCGDVPTTQGQFDAMFCLAWNIGVHGYHGSEVAKQHRLHDWNAAADAFEHWDHYQGRVNEALHNRRVVEAQHYLDASPSFSAGKTETPQAEDDGPSDEPMLRDGVLYTPQGSDRIGYLKPVATGTATMAAVPLTWWLRVKHGLEMPSEVATSLVGLILTVLTWITPHGRK